MDKWERNAPCWCGSGKKYKQCHQQLEEKIRKFELEGHMVPSREMLKTPEQIQGIRESSRINIEVLNCVAAQIRAGMSTARIDQIVEAKTREMGGIPATLGYEGYPKSVCTSVNDQVCHGIPSEEVILQEGDIVNVDVSTIYNGYFSDSSRMFCIGRVDAEKEKLVRVARECVELGIQEVRPWRFLGDIAAVIQEHAGKNGFSVVEDTGGHGIGLEFHEEPFVSYVAPAGTEMLLVPGMVFTIEPMINAGSEEVFLDESDGWGVYTDDGKPSAQWEVTVLVTEEGCEVLTY